MPRFIMIASSITETRITGSVTLRNVIMIIAKITAIERIETTLKSCAVIWMRSFVAGASPISSAFGS